MGEPVKLSRERWELLWRGARANWETNLPVPKHILLANTTEIDGITFLPAEYVPDHGTDIDRVLYETGKPIARHYGFPYDRA